MDVQEIVTGVRWKLLQQIAERPRTGAELAKELGTSSAAVSQHLKLLELGGLVSKERGTGKASNYKIAKKVALVTILDARPRRAVISMNAARAAELHLLLEGKDDSTYLRAFLCQHEELVKNFLAFGKLPSGADGKDSQLLVIASDVKALRKEYSNIIIGGHKVVIWSHTPEEYQDGLNRQDSYFSDKLRAVQPLYDPQGLFSKWQEDYK